MLAKRGLVLHGAFKSGIEKLYGYASDEDGIRHSLSDVTANVDVADAVFMFGAVRVLRGIPRSEGERCWNPNRRVIP